MLNICPAEEIDLTARSTAFYVDALPETGVDDLIYVTPEDGSYAMYIWNGEEYEKVGGSGNCCGYEITVTQNEQDYRWDIDKTYAEITEAYENGQMPYVKLVTGSGAVDRILPLFEYYREASISFRTSYEGTEGGAISDITYVVVYVYPDGTFTVNYPSISF